MKEGGIELVKVLLHDNEIAKLLLKEMDDRPSLNKFKKLIEERVHKNSS